MISGTLSIEKTSFCSEKKRFPCRDDISENNNDESSGCLVASSVLAVSCGSDVLSTRWWCVGVIDEPTLIQNPCYYSLCIVVYENVDHQRMHLSCKRCSNNRPACLEWVQWASWQAALRPPPLHSSLEEFFWKNCSINNCSKHFGWTIGVIGISMQTPILPWKTWINALKFNINISRDVKLQWVPRLETDEDNHDENTSKPQGHFIFKV